MLRYKCECGLITNEFFTNCQRCNKEFKRTKLLIEDDTLKFYYCESDNEYLIGKRVGTLYYARWVGNSFEFFMSRYLPWGTGNYPSEPKEIDFTEWLNGFLKKINS